MLYSIDDCKLLTLVKDPVSNFTRLDDRSLLPFEVKRIDEKLK